jgi:hypothetical protein
MSALSANASVQPARRSEPEWVVVLVVVVALVAGWLLKTNVESSTLEFSGPGLSLRYPGGWLQEINPQAGTLFSASDIRSGSLYRSSFVVRTTEALPALPADAQGTEIEKQLTPAVTSWSFQRGQELAAFRVLGTEPAVVGGRQGVMLHYAFVSEPIASPFRQALPVVVEAADYLIPAGDRMLVLTAAADGTRFAEETTRWFQPILNSVRFSDE